MAWNNNNQVEVVIPQPDFSRPLRSVKTTRRRDDVLFVAGEGPSPADIMFITTSLNEEEAKETMETRYADINMRERARYMKGPCGSIFTDCCKETGIDISTCYYTALIKWVLPKMQRSKPKADAIHWSKEVLFEEIKEVQPRIIACLGKPVFDLLSDIKLTTDDAESGWFYNEEFNCLFCLMMNPYRLVTKPELIEKFKIDLVNMRKMYEDIQGVGVPRLETHYQTIKNSTELITFVEFLKDNNHNILSVDCEWHGKNHVDGKLRSIQLCWETGHAAYIRFMDDELNYAFDVDYQTAGMILATHLDRPEVKYIGHHISADLPWMSHVLGLKWYQKTIFDTEFAQQCISEYDELGLDRLALKYTDLGKYDQQLILWKKKNKATMGDGYGMIPDDIMIPYSCCDVDTVMRAYPIILEGLKRHNLLEYYTNIFNPFVTDVFTNFALVGLPMDKAQMDELREVLTYVRDELNKEFIIAIQEEAKQLFEITMEVIDPELGPTVCNAIQLHLADGKPDEAFALLKALVGVENLTKFEPIFNHYAESDRFNLRSGPMMKRWVFDVKGIKPVKSTKSAELPAMSWEKIEAMPKHMQKLYTPACDKQSLQIFAQKDELIATLLQLNGVGNLCKAFLKEAEYDYDEDGNYVLVKENGLHYWLCSDGRVHANYSAAESGEKIFEMLLDLV